VATSEAFVVMARGLYVGHPLGRRELTPTIMRVVGYMLPTVERAWRGVRDARAGDALDLVLFANMRLVPGRGRLEVQAFERAQLLAALAEEGPERSPAEEVMKRSAFDAFASGACELVDTFRPKAPRDAAWLILSAGGQGVIDVVGVSWPRALERGGQA
jgi:hypothetical protein